MQGSKKSFHIIHVIRTLPETNIFAPENGWFQYDPFLLGTPIFRGEKRWFQGGLLEGNPLFMDRHGIRNTGQFPWGYFTISINGCFWFPYKVVGGI